MNYDGGKNAVYHHIINQMPPHDVYVELFLGSGAVMRQKKPARQNIGVEIDPLQCSAVKPFLPTAAELFNMDSLQFLRSQFRLLVPSGADVLIYLDPPYLFNTRTYQRNLYGYEFGTEKQHGELLRLLCTLSSSVIISGYASSLYDEILKGWRRVEFKAYDRMHRARTEILWCNFPEPVELHDYSFLGDNRTERQRIKRKKIRWKNRLEKMSSLERMSVMSAIQEFRDHSQSKLAASPVT